MSDAIDYRGMSLADLRLMHDRGHDEARRLGYTAVDLRSVDAELARREALVTYRAIEDGRGAYVPVSNKRQCVVVKFRGGKFAYVCGMFSTMAAADKRAAELNAGEG